MLRKTKKRFSQNQDGDSGVSSPQLTSLIDVMTILLVFLLQNFSAEGNLINTQPDIAIPFSEIQTSPLPAFMLQITETEVRVQGVFAIKNADFKNRHELAIAELVEILKRDRAENERRIIIEADKNLPFNIIKRVCFSANKAGFEDFEVLTTKEMR